MQQAIGRGVLHPVVLWMDPSRKIAVEVAAALADVQLWQLEESPL